MQTLSTPDLVVIAVYILGMTTLGLWFTGKQKDLQSYFVGDRNVSWFMVLISIVATETSAVTFLSVPGVAYNPEGGNFTFLQLALGYIIGRIFVAWLLLPQFMHGELFSAYQVLRLRFSPNVQRVASVLFMLTRTVADGLRTFLTALLLQYVGWGVVPAIVVVGVVTILYTYLGGMKAVIWTDLIQFIIKISGALLAGFFVLRLLPGGWDAFITEGAAANKFTMFDLHWDWSNSATLWAGVIGGAVFSMASHGADQLMVQRYLCARSLGQARLALVLSGFTIFVQFSLFLGVGVGMYLLNQQGLFHVPPGTRNDEVFGLFIVTQLPTGIVGLLVAAVLAAAMSTLSSSLNSSANAFVTDIYRPLRPHHSEGFYVFLSRIMTAVWGVAQVGVAILAYQLGSNESIVMKVLAVAGFTTGLLLGLFILGLLPWKISSKAALVGMIIGFITVLLAWLPASGLTADLPGWVPEFYKKPILAWPWFAPLGAGTTVVMALVMNLVTRSHGLATAPANRGT